MDIGFLLLLGVGLLVLGPISFFLVLGTRSHVATQTDLIRTEVRALQERLANISERLTVLELHSNLNQQPSSSMESPPAVDAAPKVESEPLVAEPKGREIAGADMPFAVEPTTAAQSTRGGTSVSNEPTRTAGDSG